MPLAEDLARLSRGDSRCRLFAAVFCEGTVFNGRRGLFELD